MKRFLLRVLAWLRGRDLNYGGQAVGYTDIFGRNWTKEVYWDANGLTTNRYKSREGFMRYPDYPDERSAE